MNYTLENVTTEATMVNVTEFDVEQHLLNNFGPKRKDLASSVVLTVVYCIIFCTGVLGNICTCVVIARNNHMHTATNYYLFSLAISDIATLILGQPLEFFSIWQAYPFQLGEVLCIFKTFLQEATVYASVLTITAFTVERFVAICHPLLSQTMSNLSRAVKIIVLLWIVAITFAIPYAVHARVYEPLVHPETNETIPESAQCMIPYEWLPGKMIVMFQISTFLFFIAPMTIITVLYIFIGVTLHKSDISRKSTQMNFKSNSGQKTSNVVRMLGSKRHSNHRSVSRSDSESSKKINTSGLQMYLVAVVVAFFVCWAPYHAQRLMTIYITRDDWTPELIQIVDVLFNISGVSYLISSTVNPILYNLMSKKYRQAFKDTICRCCFQKTQMPRTYRFRTSDRSSHLTNSTIIHHQSSENSPASRGSSMRAHIALFKKQSSGTFSSPLLEKKNSNGVTNGNASQKPRSLEKLASKESFDSNAFVELQSEHKERKGRDRECSQQMLLKTDSNENQIPESPDESSSQYPEVFPENYGDTCL